MDATDIVLFKEIHPATCKLEKFLAYTSTDVAVWLLVLFTFDRFIAVSFALKKEQICRPKRAVQFACVVFSLSVAKNLHLFWTRGYEEFLKDGGQISSVNCGKPGRHFETYVRPWIAFVFVSLSPFLAILVFNISIVAKLIKTQRPTENSPSQTTANKSIMDKQITIMCLSASFMFLATMTPTFTLLIGKPYWSKSDHYEIAKAISNVTFFLNHSLTFFLYCVTGGRFRAELGHLFVRKKYGKNSETNYSLRDASSVYHTGVT